MSTIVNEIFTGGETEHARPNDTPVLFLGSRQKDTSLTLLVNGERTPTVDQGSESVRDKEEGGKGEGKVMCLREEV